MPFGDATVAAAPRRSTAQEAAGPQARTCVPLLLAAIAVLWMATRPYSGIVHDGTLYTLQALSAADPARYADDLFLRFGSQQRFTIFSHVYRPVLDLAGVPLGAMFLTLLAQAAWLGGAYCLAMSFFRDRGHALAAVAGLVALPSSYGADFTFSYGERFLTPRLFAEALVMLALGRALRGGPVSAMAALAAAGAFHPVMALPGVAAFFLYQAFGNRAWWRAAACVGVAVGGLAVLGVEPFARLGVRLDPVWFDIVRRRAADVFIGGWSLLDASVLVGHAALAVLALAAPGAERRRLIAAVLLTTAGGLVLTGAGADLARNQFLTNAQPWRAAWLLGVTAHLMAVPLLVRSAADRGGAARDAAGLALLAGVGALLLARLVRAAHLWSAILLTLAVLFSRRRGETEPVRRALVAAAAAVGGLSVAHAGLVAHETLEVLPEERQAWLLSFCLCLWGSGLAAAMLLRSRSGATRGGARPALALATAAMLFCATLRWDERTAWTKLVESRDPLPSALAEFVPDSKAVYWYGGMELLWLRLKRSSYYSCMQGAGVIFFRETAVAYRHRSESFDFEVPKSDRCEAGSAGHRPPLSRAGLERACVREPELGTIVLPYLVDGVPRREWVPPVALRYVPVSGGKLDVHEFDRFYAYACDDLR